MTPELEPHWCPVDGCEFGVGEDRSLASVRSHVNSDTSEGHDWGDLREQVEEQEPEAAVDQTEGGESSPSDQPESDPEGAGADGSEDRGPEQGGEQPEGGESSPSEEGENGSDMATQEEYEQQQQVQQSGSGGEGDGEGEPSGESGTDEEASTTGAGSSNEGGGLPTLSTRTVVLVVGAVAVGVAIYWVVLRDENAEPAVETATADAPTDDGGDEQTGDEEAEELWDE